MIAVSGASGRLGRLTIRLLLEHVDASRVVALTRTPQAVADLPVTTRVADFDDPDGLSAAFDGLDRLLLVSTNHLGGGRRIRQHRSAVRAAAAAGVGHVLYTSMLGAGDPRQRATADHHATETALVASGVPFTVLRHSLYTELILLGLDVAVATGMLVDNSGCGATSYVTRGDCAAVAASLLAQGGHEGEFLEVTGPRAVSPVDLATMISEYTGVGVRFVPITDDDVVADLVAHGMAGPAARRFATLGAAVRHGCTSTVTDVVERLTGRRATSVATVLAATCTTDVFAVDHPLPGRLLCNDGA